MGIYIICTCNQRGRFVKTATTDETRADASAARLVDWFASMGWNVEETQTIPDGEQLEPTGPGVPDVIQVYHLRNAAGEWLNVEIYRVEDLTANISNNGE